MERLKLRFGDGDVIRAHRLKLGLSQFEFWSRLGVTQSGGSRYESGRAVPEPVRQLLHLVYAPDKAARELFEQLRADVRIDKSQ